MVKVRFSGLIRMQLNKSDIEIDANSVNDAISIIAGTFENITARELKKSVIFVNGKNITELKMFRTKLSDGDEIDLMSPVSGG